MAALFSGAEPQQLTKEVECMDCTAGETMWKTVRSCQSSEALLVQQKAEA